MGIATVEPVAEDRHPCSSGWRSAQLSWLGLALLLAGCGPINAISQNLRHPPKPFDQTLAPVAPDYTHPDAWLAFPGNNGLERSAPIGLTAVDETSAPADVFFVHPTMYLKNDVWNAAYDVAGPYNKPVLLNQLSAFNGCCRLYASHYRQATLGALNNEPRAVDLAYSDVARAFRYYIAHENHSGPSSSPPTARARRMRSNCCRPKSLARHCRSSWSPPT